MIGDESPWRTSCFRSGPSHRSNICANAPPGNVPVLKLSPSPAGGAFSSFGLEQTQPFRVGLSRGRAGVALEWRIAAGVVVV